MKNTLVVLFAIISVFLNGCYIVRYKQLKKSYEQLQKSYAKENNKLLEAKETLKRKQDSVALINNTIAEYKSEFFLNNKHIDSLSKLIKQKLEGYWTKEHYSKANTVADNNKLSKEEKDVYLWLNMARLYPDIFAEMYLNPYLDKFKIENYLAKDNAPDSFMLWHQSHYENSLYLLMKKRKPAPAVVFDEKLWESAKCHAITIGKLGLTTHVRQEGCKSYFAGECCFYGPNDGLSVIISLLGDWGVPSLGHRYICLNPSYTKAGISIQKHKVYVYNTVLDFQ